MREFVRLIKNWEAFKPVRSIIDDLFKVAKNSFGLDKIHRYTRKSVEKFAALNVLLVGTVVLKGFKKKEALQRLAEW